jgi:hypothetical protein
MPYSAAVNNPLLRKLANFTPLSDEESRALDECCKDVREVGGREDVIAQGDRTGGVKLLLDGFACRYKTLEDGRRQIVAYFVPGDLCDLRVFILKRMDHSIGSEMRRQKLITLDGGLLTIRNLKALEKLSFFNADYLHLDYGTEKPKDEEREAG